MKDPFRYINFGDKIRVCDVKITDKNFKDHKFKYTKAIEVVIRYEKKKNKSNRKNRKNKPRSK